MVYRCLKLSFIGDPGYNLYHYSKNEGGWKQERHPDSSEAAKASCKTAETALPFSGIGAKDLL